MLYTLPNELIEIILDYLDNDSLMSVYNITNNHIIYRIVNNRLENKTINHEDMIKLRVYNTLISLMDAIGCFLI